MKKFYQKAHCKQCPDTGHYLVLLDGRPVQTPMKTKLLIANKDLADYIGQEWNDQDDLIKPETMPLTQLATTCVDKVQNDRDVLVQNILPFVHGDTILHQVEEGHDLFPLQNKKWMKWVQWANKKLGNEHQIHQSVFAPNQSSDIVYGWKKWMDGLSDEAFTGFQVLVPLTGSIILSAAFMEKELDEQALFDLSMMEELFQNEKWGTDYEAQDRQDNIKREIQNIQTYLSFL